MKIEIPISSVFYKEKIILSTYDHSPGSIFISTATIYNEYEAAQGYKEDQDNCVCFKVADNIPKLIAGLLKFGKLMILK